MTALEPVAGKKPHHPASRVKRKRPGRIAEDLGGKHFQKDVEQHIVGVLASRTRPWNHHGGNMVQDQRNTVAAHEESIFVKYDEKQPREKIAEC